MRANYRTATQLRGVTKRRKSTAAKLTRKMRITYVESSLRADPLRRKLVSMAPIEIRRDGIEFDVQSSPQYTAFWERVAGDTWEPNTLRILREYLKPNETMLDIGAWIGPTVLYGAQFAKNVVAIEPDPVAHGELSANLALNPKTEGRVEVVNVCLAPTSSPVTLYCGGFHHTDTSSFGDSMTSLLSSPVTDEQSQVQVQGITIAELEARCDFSDLGFVKMDIEGGEYVLLTTMGDFFNTYRPTLYISFHVPPAAYRDERITETFQFLCDTFTNLYSANGKAVPVREVLAMKPDWTRFERDSPSTMLMTVAREGLIATF
jgi:FkbM family methyltransferase